MENNQTTARQVWRQFLNNEAAELSAVAVPVVRQLGGVDLDTLATLRDVSCCHCGAAGGFPGFIYYTETAVFWRKNRAKITALMNYEAADFGDGSAFEMVRRFKSLEGFTAEEVGRALFGNYSAELTQIYNTFAWYALEEVAYRFGEYCYDNDINIYEL